ncbi:hypothetical protein AGMMS49579_26470 [Spirochaetia bacterium]|nr:hypothetical protein AGMMS49579_26470 [Spirochaetia bacterium]
MIHYGTQGASEPVKNNGLVREPGWFSHKSRKMQSILHFSAEVVQ